LIPADGFYEWERSGKLSQPYYFQMKDESLFAFAGIWDEWRTGDLSKTSCAIITTRANELLAAIHYRMPVILLNEFQDAWLDPTTDRAVLTRNAEAISRVQNENISGQS
jgi:putative SOS response-associated peptidase YedK